MDERTTTTTSYDQECDQKIDVIEERNHETPYTFQGVLHFLQSEWNRLEMERSDWETEKAELNTRITFLEGERRGQENLKKDLVRRIKMLEYALKQERVMLHKYKASWMAQKQQQQEQAQQQLQQQLHQNVADEQQHPQQQQHQQLVQNSGQQTRPTDPQQQKAELVETLSKCSERTVQSNADWRNSRAQLRKFLQEIDCTDAVLSVRQARAFRLMMTTPGIRELVKEKLVGDDRHPKGKPNQSSDTDCWKWPSSDLSTQYGADSETSTTYLCDVDQRRDPCYQQQTRESSESTQSFDEEEEDQRDCGDSNSTDQRKKAIMSFIEGLKKTEKATGVAGIKVQEYIDTLPEAAAPSNDGGPGGAGTGPAASDLGQGGTKSTSDDFFLPPGNVVGGLGSEESLVLGNLAGLTAVNDDGEASDTTGRRRLQIVQSSSATTTAGVHADCVTDQLTALPESADSCRPGGPETAGADGAELAAASGAWELMGSTGRRQFWSTQFSLRGHLDGVRAVAFHPTERLAYSAGEDGCVMLWNLNKCRRNTSAASERSLLPVLNELEPARVYTGHEGPVLCLASPSAAMATRLSASFFTGGLDGTVRGWHAPPLSAMSAGLDMYSPYDVASIAGPLLSGPSSDSVWSLALHPKAHVLAAAHSDGTIAFWSVAAENPPEGQQLMRSISLAEFDKLGGSADPTYPSGRPTCLHFWGNQSEDWVLSDQGHEPHCLVGTSTGWLFLLDVETGQVVNRTPPPPHHHHSHPAAPLAGDGRLTKSPGPSRETSSGSSPELCLPSTWSPVGTYCVTAQDTLSLVITGHEDGHLRFYDMVRLSSDRALVASTAGSDGLSPAPAAMGSPVVEDMVAHTDAITSMATDNGHLLVTGSHDASMRVWIVDERSCISEITNHRFKNSEAIHSVAFHPKHSLVASAGADGMCNVYVFGN